MAVKKIIHLSPLPVWTIGTGSGMPSIERMLDVFDKNGISQHYVHISDTEAPISCGKYKNIKYSHIRIPSMFSMFRKQLPYFLNNKKNILYYSAIVSRKLRSIIEEDGPDCIYAHLSQLSYPAFLASRGLCPMFVRLYGSMDQYDFISGKKRFYKNSENLLQFRLPACGYIMVNDGTGSGLIAKKLQVDENRILHMHNGCDPFTVPETSVDPRSIFSIGPEKSLGLFVSRLTESKGIDKLLCILDSMKKDNIHWLIIGDGHLKEYAEIFAEKRNISNVSFLGSIPHSNLNQYLFQADVFLSLNQYSVLCNPVLEALRAHLPVFALKRGVGTGFVEKILLTAGNTDSLTRLIRNNLHWLRRNNPSFIEYTEKIKAWENKNLYTWDFRYEKEIEFINSRISSCGRM